MPKPDQILTFWLVPAEPARTYFAKLIADLARRFDAPVFEPHVTVFTTDAATEDAATLIERAVAGGTRIRLTMAGIGHSEKFTKTLFVQFDPDEGVSALNAKFRAASSSDADDEIDPHLSLLYKEMPAAQKAEVAASLEIPFSEVTLESVKAVISPADIKSRHEVEAWRVLAEAKLQ